MPRNLVINHEPLSREYLERVLPVPCRSHAETLSEKYVQMSTLDIIDALEPQGFFPVFARTQGVRGGTNPMFAVHEVRLMHQDFKPAVIETASTFTSTGIPEVIITNSHNGERALSIGVGIYRQVCSNGLTLPDKAASESYRHKHIGISPEQILEWAIGLAGGFVPLCHKIQEMERLQLTDGEETAFAFKANKLLAQHGRPEVIDYHDLLRAHRYHDGERHDLWTTFNKVQENIARGNRDIRIQSSGLGKRKAQSLRACTSILRGNKFDQDLWSLMEEFAVDAVETADRIWAEADKPMVPMEEF